jgi:threonine/homoserine/homoserine lactone efflux protein
VLTDVIGDLLPAAAAVALSPVPIVAVVLVLGSPQARTAGPAFAVGWVTGLGMVSVAATTVAGAAVDTSSAVDTGISWGLALIGVVFLVMAARQWRKRPTPGEPAQMPSWMASMASVSWTRALVLGLGLSAANPKNLALTLAASASIAQAALTTGESLIADAVFVAVGSITVVGAVGFALVAPRAAAGPLSAIRRFMTDNNATIMMVLLLVLGLKILGDAIGGS